MCRIFGFRSVIPSQVHRSLVDADNALGRQSVAHPDGWGVAYYVDGAPHVAKSAESALNDHIFRRVSGVVASETVIAHIRKATVGQNNVLNCHPFQHGRWVFVHNGDIPAFDEVRSALIEEVNPSLRRYILGDTDSEVVFFRFLSELSRYTRLQQEVGVEAVTQALEDTVRSVRALCDGRSGRGPALLTIVASNGSTMVATRRGKELYWSSHKTRCADRDTCPHLAPECEAPSVNGYVNHLLISSEPTGGENVWTELPEEATIGVDWRMRLFDAGAA